jgi:4-hydroxy-tetrahydrodipicolinate synthase
MSSTDASPRLSGYIPDIPTPFDENGAVDLKAFIGLCERQVRAGVSAILVGETAGEFSTLTSAELDALIRTAADVADGRALVVAGAGSNSTSDAGARSRRAERAGADAIMSVVPYYNKPMQAGIAAHFRAIAGSTALPIILHDIPARTIRELSDDTLADLAQSPQFVGLRDATGDLARPSRLRAMLRPGFRLFSADDTTALAFLASGGDGCVSNVSNIAPAICQAVVSNCRQGRMQPARDLQQRLAPLAALLAKEGPAAIKYALSLLGFARPDTRLPLVELSTQVQTEVTTAIEAIGDHELDEDRHRMECVASL